MSPSFRAILRAAVHLAAVYPLAVAVWDYHGGGLTANPIEALTRRSGHAAISLLIATLAARPLARWTGWGWLIELRRALGLYCFAYASAHMLIFIGLDYGFDFDLILAEWSKKKFVLAGLAAYLALLPLAATSFVFARKRLGKRWIRIHRLIYPAAVAAGLHFVWLTKGDKTRPAVYCSVLMALLAYRAVTRLGENRLRRSAKSG